MSTETHQHLVKYAGAQKGDHVSLTMQIGDSVITTITFSLSEDPEVQHDIDVMVEGFQHLFDTGLEEYTRQRLESRGLTIDNFDADDVKIDAEAQS